MAEPTKEDLLARIAELERENAAKKRAGTLSEEVYTLQEIAAKLKVSKETARRIFMREDGVLFVNSQGKRSTPNGRVRIRVPITVFNRVINSMRHVA